ncbi:response regulator [bacterium]|nr:response regulator [bacterium]
MGTKPRVMLIDDDRTMAESLTGVLEKLGCTVYMFCDPLEAMESYDPSATDAVFTDLTMPGMNGLEVLHRVRSADPSVRVVLVTGSVDGEWRGEAERAGVFRVLTKPLNIAMLVKVLAEMQMPSHDLAAVI